MEYKSIQKLRNPEKILNDNLILKKRKQTEFIPYIQERDHTGFILKNENDNLKQSLSLRDKILEVAKKNRVNPLKMRTWQNLLKS